MKACFAILIEENSISGDRVTTNRRVLLCGKSLFISGLQAILGAEPGIDLHVIDSHPDRVKRQISLFEPDVLIFEIEELKSVLPLSLLKDFPNLKLIGLDIEDNSLVVFSGQAARSPTTSDLIQVIERQEKTVNISVNRSSMIEDGAC